MYLQHSEHALITFIDKKKTIAFNLSISRGRVFAFVNVVVFYYFIQFLQYDLAFKVFFMTLFSLHSSLLFDDFHVIVPSLLMKTFDKLSIIMTRERKRITVNKYYKCVVNSAMSN